MGEARGTFRAMRRIRQAMSEEEALGIIAGASFGVLALHGDKGYPYAVPVSYALVGMVLYFHSATNGHKVDAIVRDTRVSFAVVSRDEVRPETFTTHFESVIVFGRARSVTDDDEKRSALMALARKYSPDHMHEAVGEISSERHRTAVFAIDVEHVTGKRARELVE